MTNFENSEDQRPMFQGEIRPSDTIGYIDFETRGEQTFYKWIGRPMRTYEPKSRRHKIFMSSLFTIVMIIFVSVIIVGLFAFKVWLVARPAFKLGYEASVVGACATSVQIVIMNMVYSKLARRLTTWENWEHETKHKESLTLKIFAFTFINTFSTFFYLAFVKEHVTGCDGACYWASANKNFNEELCPLANATVAQNGGAWPAGMVCCFSFSFACDLI